VIHFGGLFYVEIMSDSFAWNDDYALEIAHR
jgi:hypothetical protein